MDADKKVQHIMMNVWTAGHFLVKKPVIFTDVGLSYGPRNCDKMWKTQKDIWGMNLTGGQYYVLYGVDSELQVELFIFCCRIEQIFISFVITQSNGVNKTFVVVVVLCCEHTVHVRDRSNGTLEQARTRLFVHVANAYRVG
jgi:hypothetical protein